MPTGGRPINIQVSNGEVNEIIENADGTVTIKGTRPCNQAAQITFTAEEEHEITQLQEEGVNVDVGENVETYTLTTTAQEITVRPCLRNYTVTVVMADTDEGLDGVAGVNTDASLISVDGITAYLGQAQDVDHNSTPQVVVDISNYLWCLVRGVVIKRASDNSVVNNPVWTIDQQAFGSRTSVFSFDLPAITEDLIVELDFDNAAFADYVRLTDQSGDAAIATNIRQQIVANLIGKDGLSKSLNGNFSGAISSYELDTNTDKWQVDVGGVTYTSGNMSGSSVGSAGVDIDAARIWLGLNRGGSLQLDSLNITGATTLANPAITGITYGNPISFASSDPAVLGTIDLNVLNAQTGDTFFFECTVSGNFNGATGTGYTSLSMLHIIARKP